MTTPSINTVQCLEAESTSALVRALESDPRFRRDTVLGGIFHLGKISFREVSACDSLHIVIDGNRVSAHVDRISPLNCKPRGARQYSWLGVLAHNLADMTADLARRIGGRHGQQRCTLDCDVVWVEDEDPVEERIVASAS